MAAVALFLLAVAGYACSSTRPAVLLDADRHGRLPRRRHRCAEPAGDALLAGVRGGEAAVHLHAVRRAPVRSRERCVVRDLAGRAGGTHDRAAAGGGVPFLGLAGRPAGRPGRRRRLRSPRWASGSNRLRRHCSSGRSTSCCWPGGGRSRAAGPYQGQRHRNRVGGGDQAHAVDLHSVPAVHAASKGRGGQRADLRGHGRTWVRPAPHASAVYWDGQITRPGRETLPPAQPVP